MAGELPEGSPQDAGMSAEQGADFAALMNAAGEPEQAVEQQQAQEQAAGLEQAVQETAMMVEVAWDIVGGLLPEKVAARYGPEQRARIAHSGTMLAMKRGWSMAEFMAKWGPEIAFGAALVGPAVPLVIEWAKKPKESTTGQGGTPLEAPREAAEVKHPDGPPPGARVVQFGTVQP